MAKKPIKWTPKKIGLIVAAVLVVTAIGSHQGRSSDQESRNLPQSNTSAMSSESTAEQTKKTEKAAEKAAEEKKTEEEAAEKEIAEQQADKSAVPLSKAVSSVEKAVKKTYGSNCKVDYDENTATINLWPEGVGDEAFAAANGDDSSYKAWNKRVSEAETLSPDMQKELKGAGYPGMSVVVNILNDLNKDNALLTVTDGKVTYNWVDDEKENLASQKTAETESDIIVYLPEDGDCYHEEDCRTLKDYKQPVTLDEAINRGYKPCGVCNPPTK